MLGGSAAVVVISGALEWLASSEKERDLSEWLSEGAGGFWSVLTSNFGGPPRLPWLKGRMRLAFLFLSLNGIVVFIAYKSFLTAEMAVRRVKMPFSTLQELLESDYRSLIFVCGKQTMERSMLFSCWDYFLFLNLLEIQRSL